MDLKALENALSQRNSSCQLLRKVEPLTRFQGVKCRKLQQKLKLCFRMRNGLPLSYGETIVWSLQFRKRVVKSLLVHRD